MHARAGQPIQRAQRRRCPRLTFCCQDAGSPFHLVDLDQICCEKFYSNTSHKRGLLMADVKIDARPNGPYVIIGSIELRDTNGNVLPTQERTVLCRCGASTNKPFCDGTHSKIGFQAAAQAVPGSAE